MNGKICEEYLNPNKSKTYLLPLMVKELSLKYIENINNTFLFVEGINLEPIIAVLYKYTDKVEFTIESNDGFMYYAEVLQQSEYFIKGFELGDYSLFIFKLPEKLNYAYGCLLEGKYSWITPEDKHIIVAYLNKYYPLEKQVITRIIGILNRSDIIRKQYEETLGISMPKDLELSSKLSKEKETIDPDLVIEKVND